MRTFAFLLLTAAVAHAASPIDSAVNTAQGVGNQGRLTAYSNRALSDGEAVPELC